MRITLNPSHLKLWGKYACYFGFYLLMCFILGPHARPDEVVFVVTLPLWFLVPYIAFCFVVALIKSWLIRGHHRRRTVEIGLMPDVRIEARNRRSDKRLRDKISRV